MPFQLHWGIKKEAKKYQHKNLPNNGEVWYKKTNYLTRDSIKSTQFSLKIEIFSKSNN